MYVIKGSTLASPDKCPERIADRKVKVSEATLRVQKENRILEVTRPYFLHSHWRISTVAYVKILRPEATECTGAT